MNPEQNTPESAERQRIEEIVRIVLTTTEQQAAAKKPANRFIRVIEWLSGHWVIATFLFSLLAAAAAWSIYGVSPLQPLEEIANRQSKYRDEAKKDQYKERMVERHLKLGKSLLNVEEYAAARQEYQEALKLDPANPEAELGLFKADIYNTLQGEYNPAVIEKRIGLILEENPKDPHAYMFLGDIYRLLDKDKAMDYYQQAVTLDPDTAGARFGLGLLYNEQGKPDEALEQFKKAVELSPYNIRYLDNLGFAYSRKNLYSHAIKVYEKILTADADYLSVYYEIARLSLLRDDLGEALQYQQELVYRLNDQRITNLDKNKNPWYFQIANDPPIELYKLPEKTAYAYYGLSLLLYLSNQQVEAERDIDKIRQLKMSENAGAWVEQLMAAVLKHLEQEQPRWAGQIDAWRRRFLAADTSEQE
ncbi:MAG: tetratricopeptide repeat protein [Candidatus Competibacteraceae bacterium]